jgi:molybdate transport system permease protein
LLKAWPRLALSRPAQPARGFACRASEAWSIVEATIAIPLVLPPTVLGYSPAPATGGASPIWAAGFYERLTARRCLRFEGPRRLVDLQPAVRADSDGAGFESIPVEVRQAAECCGLSRYRTMWRIELPLAWPGIVSALVMTIAHTVGEFGVVLMVGGNIPGETRTIAISIYDRVQAFDMGAAGAMSAFLLVFSLVTPRYQPASRRVW